MTTLKKKLSDFVALWQTKIIQKSLLILLDFSQKVEMTTLKKNLVTSWLCGKQKTFVPLQNDRR